MYGITYQLIVYMLVVLKGHAPGCDLRLLTVPPSGGIVFELRTLGVTPPVGFLSLQVHGRCYGDRNSSFRNRPPCYIFADNFKWVQTTDLN